MSSFEADTFSRRAIETMTGIITTTTGVLLRKAEASATKPKRISSVTVGR